MQSFAGPNSEVHFTHLSQSSCTTLSSLFTDSIAEVAPGFAHNEGIIELLKKQDVPLDKVCLLDPKAEQALSPEDGDGRFAWFLFGVSYSCTFYTRSPKSSAYSYTP